MAWVENKKVMSENINRLLLLKGKTRKEVCEELGIGYSTFTEWANGRKYPRIDKIELMANYFGVLKSELIEDQSEKLINKEKPATLKEDAELKEITHIFLSLNSENRAKLLELSKLYLESQSKTM